MGSGTNYYKVTESTSPTSYNPVPVDGSIMQTITSTNCPTTRIRAVDARDNHTYWVQKLADGKCWMLTNLGYAGGGTNTYGDVKTIADGTASTTFYYDQPFYYRQSGATYFTTEPTPPSTSTTGTGQYGYLYNFCAVMGVQANSACANATTPAFDSSISICPAGWRLPTGNGGELSALNNAINGGSTTSNAGMLSTWLIQNGGYWYTYFYLAGSEGWYWSSTAAAGSAYAYGVTWSSSAFYPSVQHVKASAISARCLAI